MSESFQERLGIPMPEDETTRLVLLFLIDQVYTLKVGHIQREHAMRRHNIPLLTVNATTGDQAAEFRSIHETAFARLRERWAEMFDPDQEVQ